MLGFVGGTGVGGGVIKTRREEYYFSTHLLSTPTLSNFGYMLALLAVGQVPCKLHLDNGSHEQIIFPCVCW